MTIAITVPTAGAVQHQLAKHHHAVILRRIEIRRVIGIERIRHVRIVDLDAGSQSDGVAPGFRIGAYFFVGGVNPQEAFDRDGGGYFLALADVVVTDEKDVHALSINV